MVDILKNNQIINLVLRWKKHLVVVLIISGVLAVIFSSPTFIDPRYQSWAIVYPSNIFPYGSESHVEQMLQILQSKGIRDQVIEKFNLIDHYEIDSSQQYYKYLLIREFEENVSFEKTQFESVRILVFDRDPEFASDMTSSIIDLFNRKVQELQREKSLELLQVKEGELHLKISQIDSMERDLKRLRTEYGILDYDVQTREAVKRYVRAISRNNPKKETIERLGEILENLQQKGGEYIGLKENLWRTRTAYNDLKLQYEQLLRDVKKELSYTNVVTNPYPADKKTYPIRWLIVLISMVSAFFITLLVIIGLEKSDKPA